jgi:ornithine cyclodeaminase
MSARGTNSSLLVLSHADLIGLLPPAALLAPVESAACVSGEGIPYAPQRQHLEWNGNSFLTMPAVAQDLIGTKLVCVVPGNATRALPVTNGLMILIDGATGVPLALLNAAALTALRTGAVGALGVKHMTPAGTRSVGIVGCGVQGAWQAIFAATVRPVSEVFCVARSAASFERFSALVHGQVPKLRITLCRDAHELLERTELVIAATTSDTPVLPDEPRVLEGKHFIGIGSYRPTMQELPDAVYRLAGHIVIDADAARAEVGDVMGPLEKGIVDARDVFTIGALVSGQRTIDLTRTTAYKSVGMALYDLFVARALYTEALARKVGRQVTL